MGIIFLKHLQEFAQNDLFFIELVQVLLCRYLILVIKLILHLSPELLKQPFDLIRLEGLFNLYSITSPFIIATFI